MEHSTRLTQAWNIPNGLSLSRAALGLAMPVWWYLGTETLIIVILWAGISDGLDGWWARRFDARTPLGVVIDPLADKAFTVPFLFVAALIYQEPVLWLLCLVNLGYDADNTWQRRTEIEAAVAGREVSSGRPVTGLSKSKTAALFGLMFILAFADWYPWLPVGWASGACLALVGTSWFLNRRAWLLG